MALADGPEAYSRAVAVFSHPFGKAYLTVLIWCFFFHLLNGVRHLIWDTGHGFDPNVVRVSGLAIWFGTTVLAAAFCLLVVF